MSLDFAPFTAQRMLYTAIHNQRAWKSAVRGLAPAPGIEALRAEIILRVPVATERDIRKAAADHKIVGKNYWPYAFDAICAAIYDPEYASEMFMQTPDVLRAYMHARKPIAQLILPAVLAEYYGKL